MKKMREILFRGKRIDNGEWVYGYYCASIGCKNGIEQVGYFIHTSDNNFAVDPDTVGQYTGLTDKYSKKIFEGDVVTPSYGGIKIVRWENDSCGFEPFSDSCENCGCCGGGLTPKLVLVIGNIHDNPELLTEAEKKPKLR